jgi:hypothetical protein
LPPLDSPNYRVDESTEGGPDAAAAPRLSRFLEVPPPPGATPPRDSQIMPDGLPRNMSPMESSTDEPPAAEAAEAEAEAQLQPPQLQQLQQEKEEEVTEVPPAAPQAAAPAPAMHSQDPAPGSAKLEIEGTGGTESKVEGDGQTGVTEETGQKKEATASAAAVEEELERSHGALREREEEVGRLQAELSDARDKAARLEEELRAIIEGLEASVGDLGVSALAPARDREEARPGGAEGSRDADGKQ